ncbi:MAG: TldD/PmbA family protein [Actinobacteria bacterium]|nr:TldD/PmbA family protein [Actinomycetota bacterium]
MRDVTSDLDKVPIAGIIDAALDSADSVDFVDVRIMSTRTAYQTSRDARPMTDIEHQSLGLGVRTLVDGCWGFAATTDLHAASAAETAQRALAMARVSAPTTTDPISLVESQPVNGEWTSSFVVDPFSVDAAARMTFLTEGSGALLSGGVTHTMASAMAVREEVVYADSNGSHTQQQRVRVQGEFSGIAVADDGSFQSLRTTAPPVGRGWEYFVDPTDTISSSGSWDWAGELARLPERLAEKSAAPSVEPGSYTLVIDPTNLWLTIHESVGHATELDRVRGYEANYAGTSFATEEKIGSFRYGSPLMHVTGDRTAEHGLATVAWDDEGVPAQEWDLIRDGILVGYQLDRSMAARSEQYPDSNGCAYADSALHVPLQRMPNVSLQPDPMGGTLDELIAGVDDGILVIGDNSWSIDMQRYNFQFTGQRFERIRNGRLVGQVRDVAYQGSTPQFWGSLVALGGPSTYLLGGAFNCGKGQPGQVAPVSHGCPAAVFEGVNVLNSGTEAGA